MADKAKHAFGSLEGIDAALSAGKIDSFDVLFVKDADGKPYVGWIDKNGQKVIVDDSAEFAEIESELATKANAEEVDAKIATKADSAEVDVKIGKAVTDTVATANSYTDEQIAAAVSEHLVKKYEVSHKPEGTLVNYRDKEIRVMCKADTQWQLQNSGEGADVNAYYIGFKAYAPDNAVSFKEDLQKTIIDTKMYYFEGNDFAGVDENGRKYSIVWLPVARYDGSAWTYYGASSSEGKYIGWYYSVEWYDADGVMIASDCIRINLSNENCHSSIEPYYVGDMMKEVETMIETRIAEVDSAYEIIEF